MAHEPHRDERTSAAPYFSPGLVQSNEVVLRTLLDPDHVNDDGTLKPVAIALEDIHLRGWSVDRTRFTSLWRVKLFHYSWKKRKPHIRGFYILRIPVKEVRNILDATTNKREFVVIDTANFLNPAHAEVLLPTGGNYSKSVLRSFRMKLFQRLPHPIPATQSFDSKEKWGFTKGMLYQLAAIVSTPFNRLRQLALSAIVRLRDP